MKKALVHTNERGLRIGESHPRAKLTDKEVEQLIADRGPEDKPAMSLSALARRWGMSKSGVKGILDGKARGQIGMRKEKPATKKDVEKTVIAKVSLTLRERAKLRRLGGYEFVRKALESA